MPTLTRKSSLTDWQHFVDAVYGVPNNRWFDTADMLTNVHRFAMRGAKFIRKESPDLADMNLTISLSWFLSAANRLGINVAEAVWDRFPYKCSYCNGCPCSCPHLSSAPTRRRPTTLQGTQAMFGRIYPAGARTMNEAVAHMAEELGEFAEAVMTYRTRHGVGDLDNVALEGADFLSCALGVFNSLDRQVATTVEGLFRTNCHVCHAAPCKCDFDFVMSYRTGDPVHREATLDLRH